jgi:hypothetical protein
MEAPEQLLQHRRRHLPLVALSVKQDATNRGQVLVALGVIVVHEAVEKRAGVLLRIRHGLA